ncbi:hypothetical protein DENIS_4892 [Desulfonema ishimotonii]|uniref:Uncharacterized protein n=1 Tax=Desulfonema ishimotonii TaxID=45657 RepID=A0A401G3W7_9BACT|nr:hypothetical protein [Desulfonema ishimotonii]GBC63893.1 hypothetical protein DENIS_4892 [Desulfonema ishimotonii]
MSFKENLLRKMEIDALSERVCASVTAGEDARRLDKEAIGKLLEMGNYQFLQERDMNLCILEAGPDRQKILVLDNDLAIYHTTVADVALRKSPTVKEMISIRNAIKILSDSDVVVSKKADSVRAIQAECIGGLDLYFALADLEEIEKDGVASLENGYGEGVIEAITLFSELLGYVPPPRAFHLAHHDIRGRITRGENGETLFGPMIVYSRQHNTLQMIDAAVSSLKKDRMARIEAVVSGDADATHEGAEVFAVLKTAVMAHREED